MALVEHIPPELDVFSTNPFQLVAENFEEHEASPINTLDQNNTLEFFINGYANKMKVLNEIRIMATIKVTKADGTEYKATDALQPHLANSVVTSLFRSCNIYLNNVLCCAINDNFGIQELVQLSLNYSAATAQSKLSNQGFFPPGDDSKLKDLTKDSKTVELMAKLNLMNTEKLLIPNVSLGIKMALQNSDFYIIEGSETKDDVTTTTSSKVSIKDLKLYVRHVTLREHYLNYLEEHLMRNNLAIYEFKYAQVLNYTLPSGQTSINIPTVYSGVKPSIVMMFLLENATYVGSKTSDPMKFTHHDLKSFSFLINNESVPRNAYQLSITETESKFSRLFNNLHSYLGISNENTCTVVTRENFPTHCFYILQDLTSFSHGLTSLNEPLEIVNLGMSMTFGKATTTSLSALLYVLLPRKVEIGVNRNVKVIY